MVRDLIRAPIVPQVTDPGSGIMNQLLNNLPALLLANKQINVDQMVQMRQLDQGDRKIDLTEEAQNLELRHKDDLHDMQTKIFETQMRQHEIEPEIVNNLLGHTQEKKEWDKRRRQNLSEEKTWQGRAKRHMDKFNFYAPETGWMSSEERAQQKTTNEMGLRPKFDWDMLPKDTDLNTLNRFASNPLFQNLFLDSDLMIAMAKLGTGGNYGLAGATMGANNPFGYGGAQ